MRVVGIDLAGVETRPSGFCILDTKTIEVKAFLLYEDDEIVEEIERVRPKVVAIDAPLSLPNGRCCLKDTCLCRGRGHLRECDKALLKMGIKFFPVTLGPMRKLTERGIKLKQILEDKGYDVIEVYPGGAQDILEIPRKGKGLDKLAKGLERMGIKDLNNNMTDDELDAVTSALVGKFFVEDNYIALGDSKEGLMIMPKKEIKVS